MQLLIICQINKNMTKYSLYVSVLNPRSFLKVGEELRVTMALPASFSESAKPWASGSSGPTATRDICFSLHHCATLEKSLMLTPVDRVNLLEQKGSMLYLSVCCRMCIILR